jgi:hypothetical protein
MHQNKVTKLWSAIVTAFLALCTALGLVTTTAAAAVPQTAAPRNSGAHPPAPVTSPWSRVHARTLPPTMKQRIHAEAHGKTPTCRHRPLTDVESASAPSTSSVGPETAAAPAAVPDRAAPDLPTCSEHDTTRLLR